MIKNPILPGFHADPSIVRVGEDYYIATSTFEWFPGVLIYHSRDLENWRLLAKPLDRLSLLDLCGEEGSCGVWAPCLSHDGERFYLVYSDVKSKKGNYWDVYNYVVSAKEITGPWEERIYLNKSGFDPSLFHDEDGRKWVTNLTQDPRPGRNRFAGIELQEFDFDQQRLIGQPKVIFKGTELGSTEGPHLYKYNGLYYLMTAEGGTGWKHAITMARSPSIEGPYEVDPHGPVLTSWNQQGVTLEKAGHGSLVKTTNDRWYLTHLCSRPIGERRHSILGRETAIQEVHWAEDGWLRLKKGGNAPYEEVDLPGLKTFAFSKQPDRVYFDKNKLPIEFQTLREPLDSAWCNFKERPGWMRLYGRLSLFSNYDQSLLGRRVQHFKSVAETMIETEPEDHLQTSGLAAFYDDQNWFYLAISHDETLGKVLRLIINDAYKVTEPIGPIPIPKGPIRLGAVLDAPRLRFRWAEERGDQWNEIDVDLDAGLLSDEVGDRYRFTGAFFALCAQDHTNLNGYADFRYFEYKSN